MAAQTIHNLVRGLTRPYVGAHFDYGEQAVKVWRAEVVPVVPVNVEPGKVLAVQDGNPLVKAGIGAIRLIDYEPRITLPPGAYL
jgi:methionyl-tRNA formyltransferase